MSPLLDRALELEGGERLAWLGKLWEQDKTLAADVEFAEPNEFDAVTVTRNVFPTSVDTSRYD